MTKSGFLMAVTLAGAMFSASAFAQTSTWTIDSAHSSATFNIIHMGVSHVHGTFSGVKGTVMLDEKDITKSSVQATIDTTTVSTANDMRDKDLKSDNYFGVEKNPVMTFKSTGLTKAGGKLTLIGDLTLNGVTKSVSLDLDGPTPPQKNKDKTISGFSAEGKLMRKDFGVGAKTPAAVVGDEVKFTIDVEIDKN